MKLVQILFACGFAMAGGEARRKIGQGAVKVNGVHVLEADHFLGAGVHEVTMGRLAPVTVVIHPAQATVIFSDKSAITVGG